MEANSRGALRNLAAAQPSFSGRHVSTVVSQVPPAFLGTQRWQSSASPGKKQRERRKKCVSRCFFLLASVILIQFCQSAPMFLWPFFWVCPGTDHVLDVSRSRTETRRVTQCSDYHQWIICSFRTVITRASQSEAGAQWKGSPLVFWRACCDCAPARWQIEQVRLSRGSRGFVCSVANQWQTHRL